MLFLSNAENVFSGCKVKRHDLREKICFILSCRMYLNASKSSTAVNIIMEVSSRNKLILYTVIICIVENIEFFSS